MLGKFLADTDVLIQFERQDSNVLQFLAGKNVYVSALTVMEFNRGDYVQQGTTKTFEQLFSGFSVLPFDHGCAGIAAKLKYDLEQEKTSTGKPKRTETMLLIMQLDLLIAATAKQNGCTVLTYNVRHFKDLKVKTYTIARK
jgi:predicted nucleic acid-binding protein